MNYFFINFSYQYLNILYIEITHDLNFCILNLYIYIFYINKFIKFQNFFFFFFRIKNRIAEIFYLFIFLTKFPRIVIDIKLVSRNIFIEC